VARNGEAEAEVTSALDSGAEPVAEDDAPAQSGPVVVLDDDGTLVEQTAAEQADDLPDDLSDDLPGGNGDSGATGVQDAGGTGTGQTDGDTA